MTGLDPAEQLEALTLASQRVGFGARPQWTSRATGVAVLATVAILAVVGAALLAEERTLGPGRVLCGILVAAWATCALFVAYRRPSEPLATLMCLIAVAGAALVLGAALHARPAATDGARDVGASMRALSAAALPAFALHLALGLPDGVLGSRRRRVAALAGYAAAMGIALLLVADRQRLRPALVGVEVVVAAIVGVIGFIARTRSVGSTLDRARLRWVARATVAAAAVAAGAWISEGLTSWPAHVRAVALAATVLVPVALAVGVARRFGDRVERHEPRGGLVGEEVEDR